MIKRVANFLGASHPQRRDGENIKPTVDDETLRYFMSIECVERPLPYLVLMSIAQELLGALGYRLKYSR